MRFRPLLLCLSLLPALAGCSRRPAPVPRPQAWPRVEVYPAAYHQERGLQVNDSAIIEQGAKPEFFDIVYPAYGARINLTETRAGSPGELSEAVANRMERMERNAAGQAGELTSLTSDGGFGAIMLVTPAGLMTPVQFLATDSVRTMISGTAVFTRADALNPDSVAPLVRALERDVIHMLKTLRP